MTAPELTRDAWLSGRIMAWQPVKGYRAGMDAVLLAAAVSALPGESVLELGCGAGIATLCLAARVQDLAVTGVEVQPVYADLARRNAIENALPVTVVTADLTDLPAPLRGMAFDHVMMNPPYFRQGAGRSSPDPGRERALREATPLEAWINAGIARVRPGGWLTLIHRAERLAMILSALDGRMGSLRIRPLAPRAGRAAQSVIIQAKKGGRTPLCLLPPLILHRGDRHPGDGAHFTETVAAILRAGAPLPMQEAESRAFITEM